MTKEELARILNGSEYGNETTSVDRKRAKDNNLVIVYGCSDDLVEIEGAIQDELDACDDTEFIIAKPGTMIPSDESEQYFYKAKEYEVVPIEPECKLIDNRIKALWTPDEFNCSWLIKTDIPHATFDIMEDGELFCRGIVFSMEDLK
jgi:hypothetical protein